MDAHSSTRFRSLVCRTDSPSGQMRSSTSGSSTDATYRCNSLSSLPAQRLKLCAINQAHRWVQELDSSRRSSRTILRTGVLSHHDQQASGEWIKKSMTRPFSSNYLTTLCRHSSANRSDFSTPHVLYYSHYLGCKRLAAGLWSFCREMRATMSLKWIAATKFAQWHS